MLLDALRDAGSLRRFIPFDVDAARAAAAGAAIAAEYPGRRDRRGVRRLRGAPRQDPAGSDVGWWRSSARPSATSTARPARRVPGRAGRHPAPGDTPAAGHRPGQGRRPAGARLRRRRRRDGAGSTATCSRWSTASSTPTSTSTPSSTSRAGTPTRSASRCGCAQPVAQRVRVGALDLDVDFAAGEEMLTEVSCKFRPDGVAAELAAAGSAPDPLVDRPGRRLRPVAVDPMT